MIVGGHTHTLQGDFSAVGLANQHPYGHTINDVIRITSYNVCYTKLLRLYVSYPYLKFPVLVARPLNGLQK